MGDLTGNFTTLSGIAVSFAGFGTIAISLGKRDGGDDAAVDAHRLTNMLATSLPLAVAGLVPSLLAAFKLEERLQVALPSIALLATIAIVAPRLVRRNLEVMGKPGYNWFASATNLLSVIVAGLAFLACALGWPDVRPGAVYLLGLTGLLMSSVIMFSRVALSLLLPHNTQ